jgi:hypothetical protein
MRIKGRVWAGIWLLFAIVVAGWVIARNTSGYVAAGESSDLTDRIEVLRSRKASLTQRIRRAESRAVLVPRAESLGLRLPADSEIVILQTPGYERR